MSADTAELDEAPNSARQFTPRTEAAKKARGPGGPRCGTPLDLWRDLIVVPELSEREKSRGKVHWVEVWDLTVAIVLIVLCYWTPFEYALLSERRRWCQVIGFAVDGFFTMDLFLQFFVACPNVSKDLSAEPWSLEPRRIVGRYCGIPFSENGQGGWFWIDALAIMPGWLEALGLVFSHSTLARRMRPFVMLRVLRLLLRLPRVSRFIDRTQAVRGFPYYTVDFTKTVFVTTMACHWFACSWMLAGTPPADLPDEEVPKTWLTVVIASKGDPCKPDWSHDPVCAYLLAAYWSAMTLTTVGYGDITPQTENEYMLCTVLMLVSGYVWAFLVGEVVSLLSNLNPHVTRFKRRVDDLTDLMSDRNLPKDLQVRLRRYIHEAKTIEWERDQESLLSATLSPGLQREVVQCTATDQLLRGIDWVDDSFGEDAKLELAKSFKPQFFGPSEAIMVGQVILVVRRGIMAVNGRVLRRGDCWGHNNILIETAALQDKNVPRTLSYVHVMVLTKTDLFEVARLFPVVEKCLRKAQVRTAVCRAIIMAAKTQAAADIFRKDGGGGLSARGDGLWNSASIVLGAKAARGSTFAEVTSEVQDRVEAELAKINSRMDKLTEMCEVLMERTKSLPAPKK